MRIFWPLVQGIAGVLGMDLLGCFSRPFALQGVLSQELEQRWSYKEDQDKEEEDQGLGITVMHTALLPYFARPRPALNLKGCKRKGQLYDLLPLVNAMNSVGRPYSGCASASSQYHRVPKRQLGYAVILAFFYMRIPEFLRTFSTGAQREIQQKPGSLRLPLKRLVGPIYSSSIMTIPNCLSSAT